MADRSLDRQKKHPPRPCPLCAKMSIAKFRPFCSARCANIDLHHWLGGKYAIPTEETPDALNSGAENQRLQDGDSDESV